MQRGLKRQERKCEEALPLHQENAACNVTRLLYTTMQMCDALPNVALTEDRVKTMIYTHGTQ